MKYFQSADRACIWRLTNHGGWGDTLGGMYVTFEACLANHRAFLMDSERNLLQRFFSPRDVMWNITAVRPTTRHDSAATWGGRMPVPMQPYSLSAADYDAYQQLKWSFNTGRQKIGNVTIIDETPRITRISSKQATVSLLSGYVSDLPKPIIVATAVKGQSLAARLHGGELTWMSAKRQADVWFRLLSPTDILRTQLERTICRSIFLVDHLDPTWQPDGYYSVYQKTLNSLMSTWQLQDRLRVVTPLCTGISEVLRFSPWTRSFHEGLSLSQALLRLFSLPPEAIMSEVDTRQKFDQLGEILRPALQRGLFALHYRTGDTTSNLLQRDDKRNSPTKGAVQRCLDKAEGLGLFMSDHGELRDLLKENDRIVPHSIPDYKLLHNVGQSTAERQQVAWSSLLTEWYLLLLMDQLVITHSGFCGTAAMFFNHESVHVCQKNLE